MVSLDEINAELDEEYAPLPFEGIKGGTVYLLPLLDLPSAQSDRAFKLLKSLQAAQKTDDIAAVLDIARKLIEVAGQDDGGKRLVSELRSPAAMMKVIERWMAATQPGEALPSETSSETTATP